MATEIVNSILQPALPKKVKDPGSFNINIILGDNVLVRAMLDLGASINLMPFPFYERLGLANQLKETRISVGLADGSVKYPIGVLEDLLVQVDNLIIHVDFVIMEMNTEQDKYCESLILLGRPFMATTRTVIDVHSGKLSMTVLGETIQFEVFNVNHIHDDKIDECLLIYEFHGCINEYFDEMLNTEHAATFDCNDHDFDDIDESWFDSLLEDDT